MLVKRGFILKSARELELMREAGRVVRRVLSRCEEMASPGVSSAELNAEAERIIAEAGGEALFKGVRAPKARFPFPAALCTSTNEGEVQGIPYGGPPQAGGSKIGGWGVRRQG